MLAIQDSFHHALYMSEQQPVERLDFRSRLPFPESVLDESKPMVILNAHEPFKNNVIKNILSTILDYSPESVVTKERSEKSQKLWVSINAGLTAVGNTVQFDRVRMIDLSDEFYDVIIEPTRFTWARLKAWDMPAPELISSFGVSREQAQDSEIIIIPPHRNPLEPYVTATEDLLDKTPHFLQYTEIYYGGGFPWRLSEYIPGLRNFIGEVSSAL